jgi:DNA-binding MarR family transcriptional regulator
MDNSTDRSDPVDAVISDWKAVRPNLDPGPLGLVGRVLVLADQLQRSVDTALEKHSLTLGLFDILGTLRRNGKKGGMTPSQLLKSVVLSSGGLTSRLDKLEAAGLIERADDPADRRGVVVTLTAKGRRVIDAATATRFEEAKKSLPPLAPQDRDALEGMLRVWLAAMADRA